MFRKLKLHLTAILGLLAVLILPSAQSMDTSIIFVKVKAETREARNRIVNAGYAIEGVAADHVLIVASAPILHDLESKFEIVAKRSVFSTFDFPTEDKDFHDYSETIEELRTIEQMSGGLAALTSIGKTIQNRDLWLLKIGHNTNMNKPIASLMGGHHAREHLSVEVPLKLARYLIVEYHRQNPRIVAFLHSTEVHVIPMVNPDGLEYDIASGSYRYWRKNRRPNGDGTVGVDLNRNYGMRWGTVGASPNTDDETYRGISAFSEKETQIIRDYVNSYPQMRAMISYHTYSKLVLYPWGYEDTPVANSGDRKIFEDMASQMARMNGYEPMQSAALYAASGDLTDWAYAKHRIFAFTFELDPDGNDWGGGGFYPGAGVIDSVFQKNIEPALYLIEKASSPDLAVPTERAN